MNTAISFQMNMGRLSPFCSKTDLVFRWDFNHCIKRLLVGVSQRHRLGGLVDSYSKTESAKNDGTIETQCRFAIHTLRSIIVGMFHSF